MPQLTDDTEVGTVVQWHKDVGDFVRDSETLCDIESEGMTVGLESPSDGYIAEVCVPSGTSVHVGTTLARQVNEESEIDKFRDVWKENRKKAIQNLIYSYRILSSLGFGNSNRDFLCVALPSETVPGHKNMITSAFGVDWSSIQPSDLVELDVTSEVSSTDSSSSWSHVHKIDRISSQLYMSLLNMNPNVRVVFHVHTPLLVAFSSLKSPHNELEFLSPSSCRFYNRILYYSRKILDDDKDEDIAGELAHHRSCDVIVVQNEGVLIVAPTMSAAIDRLIDFEHAVDTYMTALSTNVKFESVSKDDVKDLSRHFAQMERQRARAHFDQLKGRVLRDQPVMSKMFES